MAYLLRRARGAARHAIDEQDLAEARGSLERAVGAANVTEERFDMLMETDEDPLSPKGLELLEVRELAGKAIDDAICGLVAKDHLSSGDFTVLLRAWRAFEASTGPNSGQRDG